jgi:hypothetical protein
MSNSRTIYEPTIVDILYLISMIVGFVCINLTSCNFLFVVFPIILWSIYQDWRSARVAEQTQVLFFLFSDIITVLNYIGLFVAFTQKPDADLGYSSKIWLHWGLIFVIYIIWNFVMMKLPNIDKKSWRFFLLFNILEIPIVLYCFVIFFECKYHILLNYLQFNLLAFPKLLLIIIALLHGLILFYWIYKTFIDSKNKKMN